MIHFFLNIELFYKAELENGLEVQAVACIEYPIIHVIAKTIETTEEEFDELDKFIINTAYTHGSFSIQKFSELTGIGEGVFNFRANALSNQEYIHYENETINAIEKGIEFLKNPDFEREIEKTRSFVLDGVTHRPLKSYFYKDGKNNLISEDAKDSYGNKLFNPAIIHNPPSAYIAENILNIPVEERLLYSIPTHLKAIKDYDFVLMTYPVPIILAKSNDGAVHKKIIDGFTKNGNSEDISIWQKELHEEISKLEVVVEEKSIERNGVTKKKVHFKNNWGNTRTAIKEKIFNITKDKLKYFIQKLFALTELNDNNIILSELEITLRVDQSLYESEGSNKQKLLEACLRGRDYFRQYEGIGVWLVFIKVGIGDNFIEELIGLYNLLKVNNSWDDILKHYNNNYKVLRKYLISIERFDKLEELDIYLYLHTRQLNFNQKYQLLQSE